MFGINQRGLISSSGNQRASGQMICFSEQSAGTLMDSGYCILVKKVLFNARDGQVMFEVIVHSGKIGAL